MLRVKQWYSQSIQHLASILTYRMFRLWGKSVRVENQSIPQLRQLSFVQALNCQIQFWKQGPTYEKEGLGPTKGSNHL